jgi:hypothetical protein
MKTHSVMAVRLHDVERFEVSLTEASETKKSREGVSCEEDALSKEKRES